MATLLSRFSGGALDGASFLKPPTEWKRGGEGDDMESGGGLAGETIGAAYPGGGGGGGAPPPASAPSPAKQRLPRHTFAGQAVALVNSALAAAGLGKGGAEEGAPLLASSPPQLSAAASTAEVHPLSAARSSPLLTPASLATAAVITAWYVSNTAILLMNKALLSSYGFRRPVLLTLAHMLACTLLGEVGKWAGFEPSAAAAAPAPSSASSPSSPSPAGPPRSKVAVLAAAFCGAVVLGNVSLRFIPVSFAQAIGSTTPAFTAAFAAAMLGAREAPAVYATLVPVVIGVVIATGFEPSFHAFGFGAAVAATAARAFKAVLQGVLLADPGDRIDSQALLRRMAPLAVAMLVPATLILEPGAISATARLMVTDKAFAAFLIANACLSYAVNLTNFLVTKRTSPLTLHVLGNAKGIVATAASVAIFRNPVSSAGMAGYLVAVAGAFAYGWLKRAAAAGKKKVGGGKVGAA